MVRKPLLLLVLKIPFEFFAQYIINFFHPELISHRLAGLVAYLSFRKPQSLKKIDKSQV